MSGLSYCTVCWPSIALRSSSAILIGVRPNFSTSTFSTVGETNAVHIRPSVVLRAGAPLPTRPTGFSCPTGKRPQQTFFEARRQRRASKNARTDRHLRPFSPPPTCQKRRYPALPYPAPAGKRSLYVLSAYLWPAVDRPSRSVLRSTRLPGLSGLRHPLRGGRSRLQGAVSRLVYCKAIRCRTPVVLYIISHNGVIARNPNVTIIIECVGKASRLSSTWYKFNRFILASIIKA